MCRHTRKAIKPIIIAMLFVYVSKMLNDCYIIQIDYTSFIFSNYTVDQITSYLTNDIGEVNRRCQTLVQFKDTTMKQYQKNLNNSIYLHWPHNFSIGKT